MGQIESRNSNSTTSEPEQIPPSGPSRSSSDELDFRGQFDFQGAAEELSERTRSLVAHDDISAPPPKAPPAELIIIPVEPPKPVQRLSGQTLRAISGQPFDFERRIQFDYDESTISKFSRERKLDERHHVVLTRDSRKVLKLQLRGIGPESRLAKAVPEFLGAVFARSGKKAKRLAIEDGKLVIQLELPKRRVLSREELDAAFRPIATLAKLGLSDDEIAHALTFEQFAKFLSGKGGLSVYIGDGLSCNGLRTLKNCVTDLCDAGLYELAAAFLDVNASNCAIVAYGDRRSDKAVNYLWFEGDCALLRTEQRLRPKAGKDYKDPVEPYDVKCSRLKDLLCAIACEEGDPVEAARIVLRELSTYRFDNDNQPYHGMVAEKLAEMSRDLTPDERERLKAALIRGINLSGRAKAWLRELDLLFESVAYETFVDAIASLGKEDSFVCSLEADHHVVMRATDPAKLSSEAINNLKRVARGLAFAGQEETALAAFALLAENAYASGDSSRITAVHGLGQELSMIVNNAPTPDLSGKFDALFKRIDKILSEAEKKYVKAEF
jgi:hypothetical protein